MDCPQTTLPNFHILVQRASGPFYVLCGALVLSCRGLSPASGYLLSHPLPVFYLSQPCALVLSFIPLP